MFDASNAVRRRIRLLERVREAAKAFCDHERARGFSHERFDEMTYALLALEKDERDRGKQEELMTKSDAMNATFDELGITRVLGKADIERADHGYNWTIELEVSDASVGARTVRASDETFALALERAVRGLRAMGTDAQ